MSKNIFFKSKGPFRLNVLFPNHSNSKTNIKDIKSLNKAEKLDLTFFDSLNYKHLAENTKASCCITKENLKKYLPKSCEVICVESVLFELAKVTLKFYPYADLDYPDIYFTPEYGKACEYSDNAKWELCKYKDLIYKHLIDVNIIKFICGCSY